MADKGRPLPKFGDWDVNDPSTAEGFTVIFNKARNEKKMGNKPKTDPGYPQEIELGKPQSVPNKKPTCTRVNVSHMLIVESLKSPLA